MLAIALYKHVRRLSVLEWLCFRKKVFQAGVSVAVVRNAHLVPFMVKALQLLKAIQFCGVLCGQLAVAEYFAALAFSNTKRINHAFGHNHRSNLHFHKVRFQSLPLLLYRYKPVTNSIKYRHNIGVICPSSKTDKSVPVKRYSFSLVPLVRSACHKWRNFVIHSVRVAIIATYNHSRINVSTQCR